MKRALPTTPKKRVAVIATYLDNKHSPTIQSLEKLKFVVTAEEKTDIQLGNAVLNDLKEIVDLAKFSRSDSVRTALSVIVASTSGKNITKERKKTLLSRKLGLPLKRLSKGKRVRTQIFTSEKSCWTYIERKTRKNAITDDVKKIAKCTKPGDMFNYFRELLDKFAGHQFHAQWQNAQLKCLKENLLPNHCIIIHDYSENYGYKEKFELQQTYFQRTEVSINVSVIYRHAILEVDGVESLPDIPFRYLSCYSCENCLVGTYKDCINNSIGSKATIPIVGENNRTRHSGPAESTENYEMEDLIALGTILAVYTYEADSNCYLFKADACPETLKKDTTDDWGVTYVKGSKVVRGL
ncbi:unnamed protein product [Mytilus coruscus]|uniref:Uncharacterized protein n=1 Tax=Mytilus coruscus TaxID=42192 RepID=A0A6J8B1U2_MYTCO|nr:unnamed protein product [Mytilus coruscus]